MMRLILLTGLTLLTLLALAAPMTLSGEEKEPEYLLKGSYVMFEIEGMV